MLENLFMRVCALTPHVELPAASRHRCQRGGARLLQGYRYPHHLPDR